MRSRSMATRHRNNGSGPGEAFIANTSVRENCSADLVSGHREADRAYHDPGDSAALRRPKKCISDLARSALADGLGQVVIVGAGFDPLSSELQRIFQRSNFGRSIIQLRSVTMCAPVLKSELNECIMSQLV